MSLAFSKTLDPRDYRHSALRPYLDILDIHKAELEGQHEHRRWEYAMALLVLDQWLQQAPGFTVAGPVAVDVGGQGSPLSKIVTDLGVNCHIIDPAYNYPVERTLEKEPRFRANVVFSISTIEHAEDLPRFVEAVGKLVATGGLLFLTADYVDAAPPATTVGRIQRFPEDKYHFHWMRKQIFGPAAWQWLIDEFCALGLTPFGESDPTWHGAQVYDYSFASLAMIRKETR